LKAIKAASKAVAFSLNQAMSGCDQTAAGELEICTR